MVRKPRDLITTARDLATEHRADWNQPKISSPSYSGPSTGFTLGAAVSADLPSPPVAGAPPPGALAAGSALPEASAAAGLALPEASAAAGLVPLASALLQSRRFSADDVHRLYFR